MKPGVLAAVLVFAPAVAAAQINCTRVGNTQMVCSSPEGQTWCQSFGGTVVSCNTTTYAPSQSYAASQAQFAQDVGDGLVALADALRERKAKKERLHESVLESLRQGDCYAARINSAHNKKDAAVVQQACAGR